MAAVLIVDDDRDLAEILGEVLAGAGHEVRIAGDGGDGFALLQQRLPDVVVLDVEMPVLTGPQLAYRMLVRDCGMERVPIVLVSGAADLPAIAARVGTPYVLAKPYALAAIEAMLRRALDERHPPDPSADVGD